METFYCKRLTDLEQASRMILEAHPDSRILGFYGKMGAGKTTLIKSLCIQLGVIDIVNSPTFSIVNEYRTNKGDAVYHMDFYRLNNREELMDIGCEDYFYSGSYCLIEWPEKFDELLPDNFVYIKIDVDETDNSRMIRF